MSFAGGWVKTVWNRAGDRRLPHHFAQNAGSYSPYFLCGLLVLALSVYAVLSPFHAHGRRTLPPGSTMFCILNQCSEPVQVVLSSSSIRRADRKIVLKDGAEECFDWRDYVSARVFCSVEGQRSSEPMKLRNGTEYVIKYSDDDKCPIIYER